MLEEILLYATTTDAPAWAHAMVSIYFDMRPCEETQHAYKLAGKQCFDYLHEESLFLLRSVWKNDPEFQSIPFVQYILDKYGPTTEKYIVSTFDKQDQKDLLTAFANQLGIHFSVFPAKNVISF